MLGGRVLVDSVESCTEAPAQERCLSCFGIPQKQAPPRQGFTRKSVSGGAGGRGRGGAPRRGGEEAVLEGFPLWVEV